MNVGLKRALSLAVLSLAACHTDYPWNHYAQCGEVWRSQTPGAYYVDQEGFPVLILENQVPPSATTGCKPRSWGSEYEDETSYLSQNLMADAVAQCELLAVSANNNCAEKVTAPYWVRDCDLWDANGGCQEEPPADGGETGMGDEEMEGLVLEFEDLDTRIQCSRGECRIDETLVDDFLNAAPQAFELDGSALGAEEDDTGTRLGWRWSVVPPGSLADALDFEEDDVIVEIDGRPVRTSEELLDVGMRLLMKDSATVTIDRDGQTLRKRYVLVEL